MISSHWIELLTIAVYLLLMISVGVIFKKYNSDVFDYFRSGSRGTWWLVGTSAFMSAFSAWTFTGAAGVAFTHGWSVLALYMGNALGFFLAFLFMAPWFRQLRCTTVPEIYRMRFNTTTQQFKAYESFLVGPLFAGLHLYGLAIFSASVFGFDIFWVIIILGIIVGLYATLGGVWAVMSTDFLQAMLLVPLTILIAILCFIEVGGVGEFFKQIEVQQLVNDFKFVKPTGYVENKAADFTLIFIVVVTAKNAMQFLSIGGASRYFSVKDGREARKAALLGCLLFVFGSFIWVIPGITARILYPDAVMATAIAKPAESAFAVVSLNLLPYGMTGLIVVAIFTATMSTMDSGLNRQSAIVVRDIYPLLQRLLKLPKLSFKGQLYLGQVATLLLTVLIIRLALYFAAQQGKGIFGIMLQFMAIIGSPGAMPSLLAFFIRRAPPWAYLIALCIGWSGSICALNSETWFGQEWSFQRIVITNLSISGVAFLLTTFLWRFTTLPQRARIEAFFERMHTPVEFDQEVGGANDFRQLKIIGVFALIMGILISCYSLIPGGGMRDRVIILGFAAFILLVGVFMLYAGIRSQKKIQEEGTIDKVIKEEAKAVVDPLEVEQRMIAQLREEKAARAAAKKTVTENA